VGCRLQVLRAAVPDPGENPRTQWLVYVVPTFALLAGYPLVIALVLGGLGWFTNRRATP
jgi:hypothetical protein